MSNDTTAAIKTPGTKIRELREARGWTMRQLADRAGLSESYVSRFEAGMVRLPAWETIDRLAGALAVDSLYVMTSTSCYSAVDVDVQHMAKQLQMLPEHDRRVIGQVVAQMLADQLRQTG